MMMLNISWMREKIMKTSRPFKIDQRFVVSVCIVVVVVVVVDNIYKLKRIGLCRHVI